MKNEIMREGEDSVEAISSRTAAENESQSQHSPLPWHVENYEVCSGGNLVADLDLAASDNDSRARADAAFIVTAVNAYDQLIAALQTYGQHKEKCEVARWEGKPVPIMKLAAVGWHQVGERPPNCTCGLSALLQRPAGSAR